MNGKVTQPCELTKELTQLFDLKGTLNTMLSASMYYLNQFMDSERSSIWIFDNWNQQLVIFSSLDLEKNEVRIPKSSGIAGWVFANRKPAVVNNAYGDSRFFQRVDDLTGFHTRNLICTPIVNRKRHCLGSLQSLNKRTGNFTADDLELFKLAAGLFADAFNKGCITKKAVS